MDLRREIRLTIEHELAHHFGPDDHYDDDDEEWDEGDERGEGEERPEASSGPGDGLIARIRRSILGERRRP